MLMPSMRRVNTSRALRSAICASAACRLPTWLCDKPRRLRMNTSHSGSRTCSLMRHHSDRGMLRSIRGGRITHPRALLVCADMVRKPLTIARTVAADNAAELVPVALTEVVMTPRFVPSQLRIGWRELEHVGLRSNHVDKALAQLVVREALDPPCHRLRGVRRLRVRRTEQHQRRPPPAVDRVLRHRVLLGRAVRQRVQALEALTLMERLLLEIGRAS